MKMKKQNAITLVALVITIIVLLILAGVALSLVLGENGITKRAVNSGKIQNMAAAKEKVELDAANYGAEFYQAKYVNGSLPDDANTIQDYVFGKLKSSDYEPEYVLTKDATEKTVTLTSNIASDHVTNATASISPEGKVIWGGTITKVNGLALSSELEIKEGSTVALTVTKSGEATGKSVSWSKSGNVTFVTSLSDSTAVTNPTGDTVYVKAGAYSSGTSGTVTVSATDEEAQTCNITITETIVSATLTGPSTAETGKTAGTALVVTGTTTGSTQTTLTSGVTFNQTSTDGGAVTINAETGAVTGSAVGTVNVTATVDGSLTNTGNSITTSAITIEVQEPEFVLGEPAENSAVNYGKKVVDYKSNAESTQDEIGWRVFYQDTEGNTYLIADNLVGNYTPLNEWGDHTGASTSAEGKGLNPLVKNLLTSQSSNGNMCATSWFTEPAEWMAYTDSNKGANAKATFAIASPTIELYTKSYNAVAAIYDSVNALEYPTTGTYGYTYSTFPSNLTTAVNGIYNKGSGTVWWFASPGWSRVNSNYCFRVANSSMDGGRTNGGHPVRPVVCIPTSEIGAPSDTTCTYHMDS